MAYKILYLPTGSYLSDSIHKFPVPDEVHNTRKSAEYCIQCTCSTRSQEQWDETHNCNDKMNCWVCYNELIYPVIKEHFEIVEV